MVSFVLLSGGVDSMTAFRVAVEESKDEFGRQLPVYGISFDYGQLHRKEISYARGYCMDMGFESFLIDISRVVPMTTLTNPSAEIPNVDYADIEGVSPTYVPFRNGLMLAAAASFAHGWFKNSRPESEEECVLYIGAHAEDAHNWAYPDCTPEFVGAMANAILVGTYYDLRLKAPFQYMSKSDIIRRGVELGVDYGKTWSCYKGGEVHCGQCPTCRARRAAFKQAGVPDPTVYAK